MKKKQDEEEAKEKQLQEGDITGEMFIKAEWKNNGPVMPPIKSENLFKKPKSAKNRREVTQKEETLMLLKQLYIDVNDPRNEDILKMLKETKNEFLVRLLNNDS